MKEVRGKVRMALDTAHRGKSLKYLEVVMEVYGKIILLEIVLMSCDDTIIYISVDFEGLRKTRVMPCHEVVRCKRDEKAI